jgi:hypothetical protein
VVIGGEDLTSSSLVASCISDFSAVLSNVPYSFNEPKQNTPVGYDFLDTSKRRFHVYVWYNSSFSRDNGHHSMTVLRVSRLVNMVPSYTRLQFFFFFLLSAYFLSEK